jgi:hypothetical protein
MKAFDRFHGAPGDSGRFVLGRPEVRVGLGVGAGGGERIDLVAPLIDAPVGLELRAQELHALMAGKTGGAEQIPGPLLRGPGLVLSRGVRLP